MARTVVVVCDVHQERGQRVECEELPPITIEGKSPRVIALCPECKWEYYDPFKQLVDDLGVELSEEQDQQPVQPTDAQPNQAPPNDAQPDDAQPDDAQPDDAQPDDPQPIDADDASADESSTDEEEATEDPDRIVAESPAMDVVRDAPDTARWTCPVDDCGKTYEASGEQRADDLKRLGNLHLSTSHHLDKAARLDLLSA